MKKIIMLVLVLLSVVCAFGVKVVLNNETTIEGELRGKSRDKIYLYLENENHFVGIDNNYIFEILDEEDNDITQEVFKRQNFNVSIDFSQTYDLKLTRFWKDGISNIPTIKNEVLKTHETKIKPEMLAIGFTLLYLTIDNFADASDINDQIKTLDKIGGKTSKLKKAKTRKMLGGVVYALSSAITFKYSFERVEIQASPTSLSMSYKF